MLGCAVEVHNLSKSYGSVRAVQDLTFDVQPGEIFGLLGSNGAGKTTTIRMILDLIKPDSGDVCVLGGPFAEETKRRVGYLPEERGLYRDMKVWDLLIYLGELKGMSAPAVRERAEHYLRVVDLWDARHFKVSALSRGMGQKAQFVAAAQHEPDLVIIDEPFSGLDPVNTQVIRELIYSMRDRGAAVVMSTHQMHQVEEMCERILLIDAGRAMLYGPIDEVRAQYSSNAIEVTLQGEVSALPGVDRMDRVNGGLRLDLVDGADPADVLRALVNTPGVQVERFQRARTSLDEIFVRVVGHRAEGDEGTARA